MKVRRMLVFNKDDRAFTKRIEHFCNMARNFFADEEFHAVDLLFNGHEVSVEQVGEARHAVWAAIDKLQKTQPRQMFPAELRAQYIKNLCWVEKSLGRLEEMLGRGVDEIAVDELMEEGE